MSENDRNNEEYSDFSNVEAMKNFIVPEQLPEGPYGSPRGKYTPVENKSTPWKPGQRYYSAFNYENKNLHQDLERHISPAHPTHDDPHQNEEKPYGK